ncbi:SpoIID/LytB domain-containing protein [Fictibacillus phosphorivorans]|uniref:SpoIID/LytB domain-containing protein n=1 Tax=Fictibacillus phosphorivorans TaxID=1221500 RepID=UPI001292F0A6|nr:SpoIID/LytB domain-containing protein [Fictibacillus phosphorivorans]MQR94795.1 SpoIID/LytB domain-containing protein [Fictibacillus phosphorivorans]
MKKFVVLFFVLMGLLISPHLATNASAEVNNEIVNVKLQNYLGNKSSISVEVNGKYIVDSDRRTISGSGYTIKVESGMLNLYKGTTFIKSYGSTFSVHPVKYGTDHFITIQGMKYTGVFTFVVESGKYVRPVNSLLIEDYVKGVTPREMHGTWNVNTLKAGTLAARTYAMRHAGKTMVDTQANQVYGGYTWYDNSNRAVNETNGEVLKFGSKYAETLYYSSNGGMMLSNTNTYGTPLYAYFTKKQDPYDIQSGKNTNWSYNIKKQQISMIGRDLAKPELWWNSVSEADAAFIKNLKSTLIGTQIASNSDIRIINVTGINFKTSFTAEDLLTGYVDIEYYRKKTDTNQFIKDSSGKLQKHTLRYEDRSNDIRSLVGSYTMKSPYVKSVTADSEKFTVSGGGFGHGIGMSQWGAYVMGNQGISYREILAYYYPNTSIVKESYNYSPVKMNGVSASIASPQAANTAVTLTADAVGGYDKLYRFYVQEGTEWKLLQDYSTKSTYTWIPKAGGNYKFSVHVKDKYSAKDYDAYSALSYSILSNVDMKSVTSDKPSPQLAGTPIKVSANADGGKEKLYKFNLLKDGVWTVAQEYSPLNTFNWTPSVSGDYKFSVHVKDAGSSKSYDDYGTLDYKISAKAAQTVVMQSISTDKVSPQLANTLINISANATGGATKLYKFNIYDGKTWKVSQDYSTKNTHAWKPTAAGTYKVSVHVKDQSSSKSYDSYKAFDYKITAPTTGQFGTPITIDSVVTDKVSPQAANTSIKVTANAKGGTTKLYKFWVSKDGGAFVRMQDYSTNNTYNWKPAVAGNYKINVHVKDQTSSKSYDVYKVIDYKVTQGQVIVQSVKADIASPQRIHTAINITANATGGESLLYKFNVYDGKEWSVLKEYSSEKTLRWLPAKSGSYKFSVHVKDAKSSKAYDHYGVMVYNVTN